MEKEKILVYDGSFNGFLTSVFMAFEQKINVINIQRKDDVQKGLFTDTQTILTQVPKSQTSLEWHKPKKQSRNEKYLFCISK